MKKRHTDDKSWDHLVSASYAMQDDSDSAQIDSTSSVVENGIQSQNISPNNTLKVSYFYSDQYKNWIDKFSRREQTIARISNKKAFDFNMESFRLDMFCKAIQCILVNTTPHHMTLHEMYTKRITNTKQSSEWAIYLPNTIVADALGQEHSPYQLSGLPNLLSYTITSALLLLLCATASDISDKDKDSNKLWSIIKKVVTLYNQRETLSSLDNDEKNYISYMLYDEYLYKFDPFHDRVKNAPKKKIPKISIQERKSLLDSLNDIQKMHVLPEEENEYSHLPSIIDSRRIKFAEYLTPIIAMLSSHKKYNPFFMQKDILKKKIPTVKLSIDDFPADLVSNLQHQFSIAKHYYTYRTELDLLGENPDLVSSYETFSRLVIQKIYIDVTKHTYSEERRIAGYYSAEQLLGIQFVESVSNKILSEMSIYKALQEKDSSQKYPSVDINQLMRILELCYQCHGIISRIYLAELATEKYFKILKKTNSDKTYSFSKLNKKIRKYRNKYIRKEKDFIDLIPEGSQVLTSVINILYPTDKNKTKDTSLIKAFNQFPAYNKHILKLQESNVSRSEPENKEVLPYRINQDVKLELSQSPNSDLVEIKNWVISKVIIGNNISEVKFIP